MSRVGKLRQKDLFLGALLTLPTVHQAAERAGISEATASRWLKDAAFRERYSAAKQEAFREALDFLKSSMLGAIAVLRAEMLDRDNRAGVKISAASKLLDLCFRAHELYELEQRLAAVEAALKGGTMPVNGGAH